MASSDRKARKLSRKSKFEEHRDQGRVAKVNRGKKQVIFDAGDALALLRPCRRRRAEKRIAFRTQVLPTV